MPIMISKSRLTREIKNGSEPSLRRLAAPKSKFLSVIIFRRMYTVWLDPINRLDPTGAERLGQRRVIENAQVALEPKNIRDRLLKNLSQDLH